MRTPLLLTSLLALAAVATAQTLTLSPRSASGYNIHSQEAYTTNAYHPATTRVSFNGLLAAYTTSGHTTVTYVPTSSRTPKSVTFRYYDEFGWLSNFALPTLPTGMALARATFSTNVSCPEVYGYWGWEKPYYGGTVRCLVGPNSGALALPPVSREVGEQKAPAGEGNRTFDMTDGVAALLAQGAPYAQLRLAWSSGTTNPLRYGDPILNLTYGYPVQAPLALRNFVGDATKVPVAYEVRQPGTHTVVASGTLYPNVSGAVSPVVPPGTWDVSFKASHWLRRTLRNVTVADGSLVLPPSTLVNGDVNGDGFVTAADRALVTVALGTSVGDAKYSAAADVTGDGFVTAADRAVVTLALGTQGDE